MSHVIDLTAKLLATENLTVIKKAVRTAAFDVEKRQLIIPIFKDMTQEIEGMLVCHEVGHALYSTEDLFEPLKENPILRSYVNVVEDVRIEKLMKRKYPGIKKLMTEGYMQLNQRDFFGVSKIKDPSELNLIDRMNLWFKVGYSSGVSFSVKESQFITRAEKTETVPEVIQLAKDIYEFAKEELKEKQEKEQQEYVVKEGESGGESGGESQGETIESQQNDQQGNESGLESKTDSTFADNLDESVDTSINYVYVDFDTEFDQDVYIGYKQVFKDLSDIDITYMANSFGSIHDLIPLADNFNEFKMNASRSVNYLVKEFEMKKAATDYKRTQISKSGSLDMKKIWGYQLNDDLFKRISITKDGKKHGMIFMIDWSGSMRDVISDVVQQTITLAMFCHRVQIPFKVVAFSDSYVLRSDKFHVRMRDKWVNHESTQNVLDNACGNFNLIEFFNHKMSGKEFNDMSKLLYNTHAVIKSRGYSLGTTPLTSSLSYLVLKDIGQFIRQNNIEKMSFITMTDGDGNIMKTTQWYGTRYCTSKCFVTDKETKRTYELGISCSEQVDTLLSIAKDRYGLNNIGYFITPGTSWKYLNGAARLNNIKNFTWAGDFEKARAEIRKNGFVSFVTKGRDSLMIIPSKSLVIEDSELKIESKQSASSIANKFTRAMEKRQLNRVLLNKFVGIIS